MPVTMPNLDPRRRSPHRFERWLRWHFAALALSGCVLLTACETAQVQRPGTVSPAAPEGPPAPAYTAKVVVTNLTPEAQSRIETHLRERGYVGVSVQKQGSTTTIAFTSDKHVGQVERDLARLTQPQLRLTTRAYDLEYDAVDNIPPEIEIIYPTLDGETVVSEPVVPVTVEVDATDTKQVVISGREAERVGNSRVYRAETTLKEGDNVVVVQATDEMGNTAKAEVAVKLDTTAPALAARIKIIIEGDAEPGSTVLINGQQVVLDDKGHYEQEVKIRKGQKDIEIVAIDANGNRTQQLKKLEL